MIPRYQVVPRTLIFVFHRDCVLLLRGVETKKNFPGLYNGLGGHVEHGESVLAGAERELFEESGIQGVELELCGLSIDSTHPDVGVEVHIFRGEIDREIAPIASDEGELEWVPVSELGRLPALPDLVPFVERCRGWKSGGRIFYAVADWNAKDGEQLRFYV